MEFPERVYTVEEVQKARKLIEKGYKHRLRVKGSPEFKSKVKKALSLIRTAKHYDFLRTYIRRIIEIDGLTQLREDEASIWASNYAVVDPVEAAGLFVQKAYQMKDYVEGRLYYDRGETKAVKKRIEFLEVLKGRSKSRAVKKKCEELLKSWTETTFP
ncbi:hypothetical protein GWO13_02725 [Candidatus Bathyarchaeota archaeon]|nr:hypothetical protein [Candidatus Bathyarchaeota archaeon]